MPLDHLRAPSLHQTAPAAASPAMTGLCGESVSERVLDDPNGADHKPRGILSAPHVLKIPRDAETGSIGTLSTHIPTDGGQRPDHQALAGRGGRRLRLPPGRAPRTPALDPACSTVQ